MMLTQDDRSCIRSAELLPSLYELVAPYELLLQGQTFPGVGIKGFLTLPRAIV